MLRMIPCQSSNISGLAYEIDSSSFYAQFSNGSVYRYDLHYPEDCVEWLTAILFAESQGKAFGDFKSAGFPYEKIEDPSTLDFHV